MGGGTGCRYGQMPPHVFRSGAKAMARGGQGDKVYSSIVLQMSVAKVPFSCGES